MGKRSPEPEVEAAAAGSRLKLLEDGAGARRPAGARRALRRSESSRRREDMDMFRSWLGLKVGLRVKFVVSGFIWLGIKFLCSRCS
jgi:hypothetical protein